MRKNLKGQNGGTSVIGKADVSQVQLRFAKLDEFENLARLSIFL